MLGLRFDGYYIAKRNDSWGLLRFYRDGAVIYASVGGKPETIARNIVKWFKRGRKIVSVGNFDVDGPKVSFAITTRFGPTTYDGVLQPDGGISVHYKLKGLKRQGPNAYEFKEAELP
jgi:hypothetical protein